jgi:hypothetical protein
MDSINIGGIEIKIEYRDIIENNNNFGIYNPMNSVITISNNVSRDQQQATLIHEVLEAINHIYDIGLKHHQICLLETGLNQARLMNVKADG